MQRLHSSTVPDASVNTDAVRQILARASEIEHQEQGQGGGEQEGALTPVQVELLGKELGISPNAVRQALGEHFGGESKSRKTSSASLPLLTQNDIRRLFLPAAMLGFGGFAFLSFAASYLHQLGAINLVVGVGIFWALVRLVANFLAAIPTAIFAWRKSDFRLGGVCGLLNGFAVAVGLCFALARLPAGTVLPRWYLAGIPVDFVVILAMEVIAVALIGMTVGAASRWWDELRRNERQGVS